MNDQRMPQSFLCPITGEAMQDPVMDPEGNSYERTAIEEWLEKSQTSPVTRTFLAASSLMPNRALKDAIQGYQVSQKAGAKDTNSAAATAKMAELKFSEGTSAVESPRDGLETELTLISRNMNTKGDEVMLMASVYPPAGKTPMPKSCVLNLVNLVGTARAPSDVCCVVDVSGSMGSLATMQNAAGETEAHGLTLLDIVKHAIRTIIHTLHDGDRLALIAYSSQARMVFDLLPMTDEGKKQAEMHVNNLRAGSLIMFSSLLLMQRTDIHLAPQVAKRTCGMDSTPGWRRSKMAEAVAISST
jgi:hypothetical protein